MSKPRKNGPYAPEERRFMQNFNSSTYHLRHRDERNEKTRARMAALRLRESSLPKSQQEQRKAARQASAKKYRERNAWRLAQQARVARQEAREIKERAKEKLARQERREKRRLKAESTNEHHGQPSSVPASPKM